MDGRYVQEGGRENVTEDVVFDLVLYVDSVFELNMQKHVQ